MASGHVNRIKRPNTWLHRPMLHNVKKALANPEPSTHGTNRRLEVGQNMSALPGYFRHQLVPLLPGHHLLRCRDI